MSLDLCIQSEMILEHAGMNLRKLNSNAPDLLIKLQSATTSEQTTGTVKNPVEDDETYAKTMSSHSVFNQCGNQYNFFIATLCTHLIDRFND